MFMKCESKSVFFDLREQSRNTMWNVLKFENQISKQIQYNGLQCYIKNKIFKKRNKKKTLPGKLPKGTDLQNSEDFSKQFFTFCRIDLDVVSSARTGKTTKD